MFKTKYLITNLKFSLHPSTYCVFVKNINAVVFVRQTLVLCDENDKEYNTKSFIVKAHVVCLSVCLSLCFKRFSTEVGEVFV